VPVRVRVRVRDLRNRTRDSTDDPRMPNEPPRLDHENLDVYRCSLDFVRATLRILGSIPPGERELRDQWKRAAMSISLNIAEGAGKPSIADRARYHAIARGSAMECGALLDIAELAGHMSAGERGVRERRNRDTEFRGRLPIRHERAGPRLRRAEDVA